MPNLTDVLNGEDENTIHVNAKEVCLPLDGTGEMDEGSYVILNVGDTIPSGFKVIATNGNWLDKYIHSTGKQVSFGGNIKFEITENAGRLTNNVNGLWWENKQVLVSNPNVSGADAVTNIMSLTQNQYDSIGTPNATTLYLING